MSATTARALALLNLLQVHRHWPGAELADRLGVTERTVRRDVERLRELGYHVESAPGVAGGYRLRAGKAVPPLLLTDDEAVAIAIGLRLAAAQRLVGGAETSLTALAKLEQVLPPSLRRQVNALAAAVRPVGVGGSSGASPEVLGELALSCRDHERVRFTYTSATDNVSRRHVEPHYLVPSDRHWYAVCWDLDKDDWRTFRVDRLSDLQATRWRFEPHPLTDEQAVDLVRIATSWGPVQLEAAVVMELPIEQMLAYFGPWGADAKAVDGQHTRWPIGGGDVRDLAYAMGWVPPGVEYTIDLPDETRSELREILERMLRAVTAGSPNRPAQTGSDRPDDAVLHSKA